MRLIDADALKYDMQKYFDGVPVYMPDVFHTIERSPTIEAEPVRHGEWYAVRNIYGETKYSCSKCGHYIRNGMDKNYCPNCGTKMDGGKEDGTD